MSSAPIQSSNNQVSKEKGIASSKTSIPNQTNHQEIEQLEQRVRELVTEASAVLHGLGPDRSRIAWILEDALMYLDEISVSDRGDVTFPNQNKNLGTLDLGSLEQLVQGNNVS
jgi:hypothetical protein